MSTKKDFIKTIFLVITIISLTACVPQASPTGTTAPVATPTQAKLVATSSPSTPTPAATFSVTSTLDGLTTLPHRIQWEAKPNPENNVSEVNFLIDGQLAWVEKNTPYFYGDDNNYLVTSFLTPGEHSFTVHMVTTNGQSVYSTEKASVEPAPVLSNGLADSSWGREVTASDVQKATSPQPPPTGQWTLTISSAGWMVHDPQGGGLLFDVDYQSGGKVEFRRTIEEPPYPNPDSGGFCDEPDPSALWTYTFDSSGKTLSLLPVDKDTCGDRQAILEGAWTLNVSAASGLALTSTP